MPLSDFQGTRRRLKKTIKASRLHMFSHIDLGWNLIQSLVINCVPTHSQCDPIGTKPWKLCIYYWCRWSVTVWKGYISGKYLFSSVAHVWSWAFILFVRLSFYVVIWVSSNPFVFFWMLGVDSFMWGKLHSRK